MAVRADGYSDFGSTVNPKIALAWRPVPDWLLVRASFSTGFRAPSLVQSSTGSLTFSQDLQDTTRFAVTGAPEDESSSVQILSGGNPDLDAEDSDNFSTGIVFTPPTLPGLTLSADFFRIKIDNAIASLDPQFILDNEADFPGLVVRAPASATDEALGIPGNLLLVNTQFQNLGFVKVQGVDATLEYLSPATRFGRFSFRADAALIDSFEQQASAAEPVRDLAGTYLRPRARVRTQAGWGIGGFDALFTFNYTDTYEDAGGERTVDYQTTFDAFVEYRFGHKAPVSAPSSLSKDKKMVVPPASPVQRYDWLSGLVLQAGVLNIFDDPPPFANNPFGYPVGLEDPRQRFVFFGLEKKF